MSASKESAPVDCLPLPDLPESQQGTSTASHSNYKASVSNAAGYLCHIQLQCRLDVSPEVVFEIFSHPDNAGAFRDIKKVGYRKVIESSPGFKRVEVEQVGELRVMWVARSFKTYLDVTEDSRDAECLKTEFTLLRSDILSRFHGAWELRPLRDSAGNVVGCDATLTQDVLPRGVPTFFARLPVLGGLLRQVSLGTIKRLVEDLLLIVKKYKAGAGKLSVGDVLVQIASYRGHKTVLDENRAEKLSDSEGEEGAAAGGGGGGGRKKKQHSDKSGKSGSGGSSSGNGSNVTSFAVDDFSESEDMTVSSSGGSAVGLAAAVGSEQGGSIDGNSSSHGGGGDEAETQPAASGAHQQDSKGVVKEPAAAVGASGAAAASAAAAAVAAAGAAAAATAAGGAQDDGLQQQPHSKHKHKQKHSHQQAQQQEEQHQPVGVMLDVSQRGHVSVVLVPGDLS